MSRAGMQILLLLRASEEGRFLSSLFFFFFFFNDAELSRGEGVDYSGIGIADERWDSRGWRKQCIIRHFHV